MFQHRILSKYKRDAKRDYTLCVQKDNDIEVKLYNAIDGFYDCGFDLHNFKADILNLKTVFFEKGI